MNDPEPSGSTLKDPVCGMEVNPESPFRATYEGREYLFCSRHCLAEFQKNPKRYLAPLLLLDPVCGMSVQTDGEFRTIYKGHEYIFCSQHCLSEFQEDPEKFTAARVEYYRCPMHPEIREAEPGKCPKCGMALEAVKSKWICPYHPKVLHDAPGVCPIYGKPLIPEPPGRFYYCVLHPEVKQLEPGKCSKCEMELQPSWAPAALLRTEWFCPMHSEVAGPAPGPCPKCGMKLEPREVPAEKEKGPEGEDARPGEKVHKKEVICPKCGLRVQ